MPLSYVEYAVATTGNTYTIDFKFLDSSHVKLSVTSGGVLVDHTNFTINSDGTIMTLGGSYEVPIRIYRQTPGTTAATKDDQVIDFQDGAVVSESDLDRATLQALYASQESKDYVDDSVAASTGTGELPTTTNANYILSSGTGVSPTPTWISSATLQPILPAAVANTVNTIPIRSSDTTPTITSSFVGDITGDVTGDVSGSAGTLAPGRTISITGDVTYTSPIYTGSGDITAAATVIQIQNKAVSSNVPAEGGVLVYRTDTWTPEISNKIAVFAEEVTGDASGQVILGGSGTGTSGVCLGVILNLDYINTINDDVADDCLLEGKTTPVSDPGWDADSGLILLKNGTYHIEWTVPFWSVHSGYTVLRKSTSHSIDSDGLLDSSVTVAGKATVATDSNPGLVAGRSPSSFSHGFGKVTATTGTYIQLQAYSRENGTLGASGDSTFPYNFFHTFVIIRKE